MYYSDADEMEIPHCVMEDVNMQICCYANHKHMTG